MNISTMPLGPNWSATIRDERYSFTAPGKSHEDAISNLEGKLALRLEEINAEADWIKKALVENFAITEAPDPKRQ